MTVTKAALNAALQNPVMENGQFSPEFVRFLNELVTERSINTGPAQPSTITSGIIEKHPKFSYYSVDTESAAASDNLDTITNGNEGDLIFIQAANSTRTVVIRDNQGNILTDGSVNISLDNTDDLAILHYNGTVWKCAVWNLGT